MAMLHRRKSMRLPCFDYATHGAYFVTVCAHQRRCILGDIEDGAVRLAGAGEIVAKWWNAIPSKFHNVETDSLVIMPNHVHGILWLVDQSNTVVESDRVDPVRITLPRVLQWFKTMSTNEFIRAAKRAQRQGGILWQRSYWERVIRDDQSRYGIRRYIDNNPRDWAEDEENPANERRPLRTTRTSG